MIGTIGIYGGLGLKKSQNGGESGYPNKFEYDKFYYGKAGLFGSRGK
jgi:hypothetical protein